MACTGSLTWKRFAAQEITLEVFELKAETSPAESRKPFAFA